MIAMRERLRHRGPDDEGMFVAEKGACVMAHTRLAVLDLTSAGHQPMTTADQRLTIVFNGEIYNFQELRSELRQHGVAFSSNSDTEVVLKLYERDGKECVAKLDGMFAFAIWDQRDHSCFFARDPLGIKPFYFWRQENQFAFASEIRSLLEANLGPRKLSQNGLAEYLLHGSVQEPNTLVDGIEMLPAGHSLCWNSMDRSPSVPQKYWDIRFGNNAMSNEEATLITRLALEDSMRRHLVSDVPVGVFLSGGIDSTSLVALARSMGNENLSTFCVGFGEAEFDEGDLADRTAKHFRTNHHQLTMNAEIGKSLLSGFLDSIDLPSNDGFNTYCVSQFASQAGLKVVLSGVGGDEIFGGYPSFSRVPELSRWATRLRLLGRARHAFGLLQHAPGAPANIRRLAALAGTNGNLSSAYWSMRGFFTPHEVKTLCQAYGGVRMGDQIAHLLGDNLPEQPTEKDVVSYLELTRYMRNQLLRDSDVMSMAHGLELRVPLVDRKFIDSISEIPSALRHAAGKRLMLAAVPEIPGWITNQPKRGFRFPFDQWISSQWGELFNAIDDWSPFRLQTWYRRWSLFTLHHFLKVNCIETAGELP